MDPTCIYKGSLLFKWTDDPDISYLRSNELININGISSRDSELWDLPGSLEPDSMAGRFPSALNVLLSSMVCIGIKVWYPSCKKKIDQTQMGSMWVYAHVCDHEGATTPGRRSLASVGGFRPLVFSPLSVCVPRWAVLALGYGRSAQWPGNEL